MKKIMFVNFPASGHVNPQLNMCRELAKKDIKLLYYTFDQYFPRFKGIHNIELRKYPDDFNAYYHQLAEDKRLHEFIAFIYVFYTLTERVLPFMKEEVEKEKPDLILCDSLAIWGKIAARIYGVPMAYFFSSLMGDSVVIKKSPSFALGLIKSALLHFPYVLKFNQIKKRIERQYGKVTDKPQEIMSHQGKFTIVMTSREFHPGGEEYGEHVKFIGPSYREDSAIPEHKDKIFISLGTIAFSDTFWDACIEATKGLGYEVVISFGGAKNNKISRDSIPENVKVYDNLSLGEYREVLKHSALFISHGGFNSISDAILYKTPLLICPITAEQVSNGKLVEQYGCGAVYIEKRVNINKLRNKVMKVLYHEEMKSGLEKYRQSFLHAMGYEKAVEALNDEFGLFSTKTNEQP